MESGVTWKTYFDLGTLIGQFVALLTWYLLSFSVSIVAIAALAQQDPNATAPTASGWLLPLFTATIHLAFLITSYALIPGYVAYPVNPRYLFAMFDMLTGTMLGFTVAGIAANSLALLMVTNFVLVLTFLLAVYKYATLILDIRGGRRSATSGARIKR
jgi:hypothetical protein